MEDNKQVTTLDEFIIDRQKDFTGATGELSSLLRHIGFAAKVVNREVNKAGLVGILGLTGETNVQGEKVKKLDVFANKHFIESLSYSEYCAGVASEEEEEIFVYTNEHSKDAKYVVLFDPLDGSSNTDVNVSIGTIFSIFKRVTTDGPCTNEDFLQKGTEQVAAGYIIYGSSTIFVYTTGKGVNGFTLDPSIGEFFLSHPDIKTPEKGKIYSVNQGGYLSFDQGVKDFIKHCQSEDNDLGTYYTLRYIGSFVSDFHRNLIKGGIYIYPTTNTLPEGKLRLLYECNPMAFIVEQAGGTASYANNRILEMVPNGLHQRTPIFIGSKFLVAKAESFLEKAKKKEGV